MKYNYYKEYFFLKSDLYKPVLMLFRFCLSYQTRNKNNCVLMFSNKQKLISLKYKKKLSHYLLLNDCN